MIALNKFEVSSLMQKVETCCKPYCTCHNLDLHGIPHLRRVAFVAGRIAGIYGEDTGAAVLAGFLHDCARTDDGGGNRHAHDSAALAKRIVERFYPQLDSGRICECIRHHADGLTTTDRLTGSVWDADRRELSRLRCKIMPELLSTDIAKRIASIYGMAMKQDVIQKSPFEKKTYRR